MPLPTTVRSVVVARWSMFRGLTVLRVILVAVSGVVVVMCVGCARMGWSWWLGGVSGVRGWLVVRSVRVILLVAYA